MNTENYKQLFDSATLNLASYQLYDALAHMKAACIDLKQNELSMEEESIENDYSRMLQFIEQGGNDPQRDSMHQAFLVRATHLLYRIHHEYLHLYGSNIIGESMRSNHEITSDEPEVYITGIQKPLSLIEDCRNEGYTDPKSLEQLYQELYQALERFFYYLLTADLLNETKRQSIIGALEQLPEIYVCPLIAALYLNTQEAFDQNKMKIIFHLAKSTTTRVRLYALTAFLILYNRHEKLIQLDSNLYYEFLTLQDDPQIQEDIINIQKQLYLSKETEKASQILNKDILPNMMKSGLANMGQMGMNMNIDSLLQGNMGEMGASIENNMKSLSQMTQSGYDINYTLFVSICRNSFFSRFSNWFCIFDPNHPELAELRKNEKSKKILESITQSTRLCELDKYATVFLISHVPESMRAAMIEGTLQPETEDGSVPNPELKKKQIIRSCIQDLYRFYTKNLNKKGLKNLFEKVPYFGENDLIMKVTDKNRYLEEMARFFMKTELYEEARECLLDLLDTQSANAWILHSLAVVYEKIGIFPRALQYEQQAELLDPDNIDILLGMQNLCLQLEKHSMRISYLKRIEEKQPLSEELEMGYIMSLIECERYEEALQRGYKMEYMEQNQVFAERTIAWCSLYTHKPENASKYYEKVLQTQEIIWGDYLNAGHAAWINKDIQKAIGYYRNFVSTYNQSEDAEYGHWTEAFEQSVETIEFYGIDYRDFCLMKEIIRPKEKEE